MLFLPGAASAQLVPGRPNSIELRPSASLPVGDFGKTGPGLGAGRGVGGAVALRVPVASYFALYGSYDYERFKCGECGAAGLEDYLSEAGFEAGLEASFPAGLGPMELWLGGGVLIGRKLEIRERGDRFSSDSSTGWSAAAGVLVPIFPFVRLRPGIRYRSYSAHFVISGLGFALLGESGDFERQLDVQSISFEVGLSFNLPYES